MEKAVTGYSEYVVEAFSIKASGYLMKPVKPEDIRREIDYVVPTFTRPEGKLQVQCFRKFEVFWKGASVPFKRLQTKELFAFLIDHWGGNKTAILPVICSRFPLQYDRYIERKRIIYPVYSSLK